jgi:hypothetical protein
MRDESVVLGTVAGFFSSRKEAAEIDMSVAEGESSSRWKHWCEICLCEAGARRSAARSPRRLAVKAASCADDSSRIYN